MKAKLPTSRDPGFTNVMIVPLLQHGDYTLWLLADEKNDVHSSVYALINGVLLFITSRSRIQGYIDEGKVPERLEDLAGMFRKQIVGTSKVVWEALGLPEHERLKKWEAAKAEHDQRNAARAELDRAQKEKEENQDRADTERRAVLVMKGERVSGEDLIKLCRVIGIKIAPATAGALKWFSWITETEGSTSRPTKSRAVFAIYTQAKRLLLQAGV